MAKGSNTPLHLPDLTIRGFRGIERLEIPAFGRVTLLAGENGVGKTTVLEAVQAYAARGSDDVLSMVLQKHGEYASVTDEGGNRVDIPVPAALFYGRRLSLESILEIGPINLHPEGRLKIEGIEPTEEQIELFEGLHYNDASTDSWLAMKVTFARHERSLLGFGAPRLRRFGAGQYVRRRPSVAEQDELPPPVVCRSTGPGVIGNDEIAELWDDVALTEYEDHAIQALGLAVKGKAERVAAVSNQTQRYRSSKRRLVVKLRGDARPVPLRSLGDGAVRLFGLAVALVASRNGFLLIDEVENGLHHTVLYDFWRMVLQAAEKYNVQVLATTHSFDSIGVFGYAASDCPDSEGVVVRLERRGEGHRAVMYSEKLVKTAAERHIEVR